LLPHQKRVITEKTAKITPHHFELEEDGVHLHLSVIDTPGFGDQINREDSLLPILQYLTDQYDKYTEEETNRGFRRTVTDTRVHALLYFISPNCHRLKELDLASLKQLSSKVNVIPVVAKADTMTSEEKAELKAKILGDLSKYDVRLYPTAYSEDREEIEAVEAHQPFCVIGADKYLDVGNGKYVRGRQYKWGLVDVENTNHCDFVHLRSLLISSNLNDLTETTHSVHYLNYRYACFFKNLTNFRPLVELRN
jgi:septin family protein